jgi:hypothetical protein
MSAKAKSQHVKARQHTHGISSVNPAHKHVRRLRDSRLETMIFRPSASFSL